VRFCGKSRVLAHFVNSVASATIYLARSPGLGLQDQRTATSLDDGNTHKCYKC